MVDEVLDLGLVPLEEFHQRVHDVLPKSNRFGVDGFTRELQELGRLVRLKAQKLCFPNSTEMAKKNRYADVLPYADSRVILNSCEDDPIKQYINASHVKLSLNGHICQYITTQAPIPNTFNDFWRMIWDTNSQLIVMLTKSQESNRIKADQYWPDQIDEKIATKDFAIVMKKYQVQGDIIIRQLNLIQSENSNVRMITHIQYIGWPDHGIPENFDSYVQLYEIYRKFRSQCSNAGPICIHCSAGIGRSGTFVGIDALLDHMFNMQNNQEIDKTLNIMKIVYEMRLQRAGMVQTKGQYIFLYQFIDHCLRSGLFEIQLLQK